MPNLASLGIRIDSGQVKTGKADLDKLADSAKRAEQQTDALAASNRALSNAVKGIGIAVAVREYFKLADAATTINSRLKLVTSSTEQLADVQTKLFLIAQNARVGYAELVNTYSQVSRATGELGISQTRLLGVVQTISKAITISGVSAGAASAALTQLTQGLASGTLRGDELNSVLEQTPRLAQAIAQGMGVSVGQLRAMGQEGAITADTVVNALEKMGSTIDKEFEGVAITVSGAFQQLQNAALRTVGKIDQASGASNTLARALQTVSDAVDTLGSAVENNRGSFEILASGAGWALGLTAVAVSIGAVVRGVTALAVLLAANPAVLAVLGVGTAIGALGAAASANAALAATIEGRKAQIDKLAARVASLTAAAETTGNEAERARLQADAARVQTILDKAKADLAAITPAATKAQEEFLKFERAAEASSERMSKAKLGKWMKEYATDAEKMAAELDKAKKDLGEGFTAELEKRIRAKYTKKAPKVKDDGIGRATLGLDLDAIHNEQESLSRAYANAGKIIEAGRAASLLTDQEYYAAKRGLLELDSQAQESALQKEIDRLEAEKVSGKDRIDNLRRIADAQAKLTKVRADAATGLDVLSTQETAATKRVQQGYRDAEDAAKSYLDTIRRAQARELAGIGAGTQERDRTAGRAQIEDKYSDERRTLEKGRRDAEFAGTFGPEAQKKYDDELDRLRRFQAIALSEYDKNFAARLALQADWQKGASEALKNYYTDAANISKQTEDLFTKAFKGMEDALVSFVMTGKLDFKSLADSIIADMARIAIKQLFTAPLAKAMDGGGGGLFGAIASLFIPGRAAGGPVSANKMYQVNERGGPGELLNVAGKQYLMTGPQGGSVTPNAGANVTNNFSIGAGVTRGDVMALMQSYGSQLKGEILSSVRNNGAFAH